MVQHPPSSGISFAALDRCPSSGVSAITADWSRERMKPFEYAPGRRLLKAIRDYQACKRHSKITRRVRRAGAIIRHRIWSAISGADIPVNRKLEGGVVLPHPNGIVIHPDAVIGPNCLIFQQVTIGADGKGVPVIEGHVDIGAGAKILGAVTIGRHARIGANAVVICDVPAGATAVGVPARIIDPL